MTEHGPERNNRAGPPTDRGEPRVAPLPPLIGKGQLVRILDDFEPSGGDLQGCGPNEVATAVDSVLRALRTQAVQEMRADRQAREQLRDVLDVLIVAIQKMLEEVSPSVFQQAVTHAAGKQLDDRRSQHRGPLSKVQAKMNQLRSHGSHPAADSEPPPVKDTRAAQLHEAALMAARAALGRVEDAFSRSPQPPEVRDRPWDADNSLMRLVQDLVGAARRRNEALAGDAIDRMCSELERRRIRIVHYDPELEPEQQTHLFTFHGAGDAPSPQLEELTPAITVEAPNGAQRLVLAGEVHCSASVDAQGDGAGDRGEGDTSS
ncbi:hypothetical protein [Streptomyces alboniger]|uniref:Uncharacterized protein n=1 Tax=Streptomyces alboniger TaxID=132473 RepID=A0A5J6HH80_STRAD|nr:hypothetical protein [Streptomyces alboniger]QEV16567.1 hypothetical protein CP975_02750 [Streptomyces alboniger]